MSADDLFAGFLKGRRTFALLSDGLAEIVRASPSGLAEVEAVITSLVNTGRLPVDLAQILRASLPRPAQDQRAAPADDAAWLDAPTEITPAGPPASRSARGSMPVPAPMAAPPLPPAGTVKAEVDEVILAALTDGFKELRRGAAGSERARPATQDRLLDSALESFRGVRLRRDAAKASGGDGRARGIDEAAGPTAKPVGIGTILKDRFVLDREIGRGGMGVVYRAVDRRRLEAGHEQPYVAVKLLSGDVRRSPEAFRALESEARRVQSLAHPNIVTIFDFDRDGTSVFIVMELLQGRPLDAVLAETGATGLGFETSRALVDEISSGLAFAHGRGVIHCDLKPANIFVLDSGAAKILDFGLAIASRGGRFEPGLLDGYTLAYASPEMLQGQDRHPSDDVYALGCLVYAMVSGRRPFGTRSALEARGEGLKLERPSRVPRPAWNGLRKALSLSRDDRLPDAASFRSAYFDKGWRGFFRR